jgi:hypothetical protein
MYSKLECVCLPKKFPEILSVLFINIDAHLIQLRITVSKTIEVQNTTWHIRKYSVNVLC